MEKWKSLSPLRYLGGKSKQLNKIMPYFDKNKDIFIDLFCGGCSVGLSWLEKFPKTKLICNDIDLDLIIFWNWVRWGKLFPFTFNKIKELVNKWKKVSDINFYGLSNEEIFFIKNCVNFSGFQNGTPSQRSLDENFTLNKIKKLENCANFLYNKKNIHFSSYDYKNLIDLNKEKECINWYIDPPYFYNKGNVYKYGKINFQELKIEIDKIKGNVVISLDNSDYIKDLFNDKNYKIIEEEWTYTSTNKNSNKCKKGKELIILKDWKEK